jgi:ribosome maturation factor RimP
MILIVSAEIKMVPGNNIQVFVDADAGLPISRCIQYNCPYKRLKRLHFSMRRFCIEVSSPGLKNAETQRQYSKIAGKWK